EVRIEETTYIKGLTLEVDIVEMLRSSGLEVIHVGKRGDGGVDIICNIGEKKIMIQCKNWYNNIGVMCLEKSEFSKVSKISKVIGVVVGQKFSSGAIDEAGKSDDHPIILTTKDPLTSTWIVTNECSFLFFAIMSSKLKLLKQRITELEADNAELRKEYTEIPDLRRKLAEIPDLRRKISEFDAERAELKRRIAEALKMTEKERTRRGVENAKLKARIEELESEFRDRITKVEQKQTLNDNSSNNNSSNFNLVADQVPT
ncbi:4167_t:CDS:2, partial [Cetraspora pellucida]